MEGESVQLLKMTCCVNTFLPRVTVPAVAAPS